MEIKIGSRSELPAAAKEVIKFSGIDERRFLFEGEMGAGKTTLIKSICAELGSGDIASSPTYSIVNEYTYPGGKIYHFDFFRINREEEALDLGIEEYLSSGEYCFIEWPERIRSLWPLNYIEVRITELENGERSITLDKI